MIKTFSNEKELIIEAKEGNNYAIETLIDNHIKLIYKLSYKYDGDSEFEDMVSSGIVGLLKALKNYNVNSGVKFITYAFNYVKHEIYKTKNQKKFFVKTSDSEIRKYCNDKENNRHLERFQYNYIHSLEDVYTQPINSNYGSIENLEKSIFLDQLIVKSNLSDIELFIIKQIYYNDVSTKEIGTSLNVNSRKVRQIQKSALTKMKNKLQLA